METDTIALVGATELGRLIACAAVRAGYRTILEDVSLVALEQGIAWIAQALGDEMSLGELTKTARDAALANLSTANSAQDASRQADLIIETVSDEVEMKIELFTIFDKFAKPGAIFASTNLSLGITELAAVTFCPERCIGMRFSVYGQRSEHLELVKGRETSGETVARCRQLGRRLGMQVSESSDDGPMSARSGD